MPSLNAKCYSWKMAGKKHHTPIVPHDGLVRRLIEKHKRDPEKPGARLLQETAEKLMRYGRQVGVMPLDMISLLDDGISISDLVAFLAAKSSGAA